MAEKRPHDDVLMIRPGMPRSQSGRHWRWLAPLPVLALVVGLGVYLATSSGPACSCPEATFGTVLGTLQEVGGPGGKPTRPVRGTVVVTSSTGERYRVNVSPGGTFTVRVSTGTYTAVGASPLVGSGTSLRRCAHDGTFVVGAGSSSRIDVACQIK